MASAKEAEPEVKGDLLSHNTDLLLAHNKVRWSSPTLCLSSSSSLSTTFTFFPQSAERGQSKQVDEAAHHTIAIIQVDQSSPSRLGRGELNLFGFILLKDGDSVFVLDGLMGATTKVKRVISRLSTNISKALSSFCFDC